MNNIEQTLSIIKPDAVERNLTEDIKKIFIENNLKILKKETASTLKKKILKQEHLLYRKALNKVFFNL